MTAPSQNRGHRVRGHRVRGHRVRGHRVRDDRGTTDTVGLALMAPVAVAVALAILLLSRDVDSRATAQSAAEAAAQAAAQERTPASAQAAAQAVGDAMLIDSTTCASPSVSLGGEAFTPGNRISVTVSCTTSLAGLGPLEAAGRDADVYTAYAVLDPYRGVG